MKLRIAAVFALASLLTACAGQPRKWGGAAPAAAPGTTEASTPTSAPATSARSRASRGTVETTSASIDTSCEGARCIAVCDRTGDGTACKEAGYALRDGTGVEADFARAAAAFDKSCRKNNRYGCHELAKAYGVGEGVTADVNKSIMLYSSACDAGVGQACDDLAKLYDKGESVGKDHAKAIELLARGCVAEDFQVWTCTSLRKAADAKDKLATKAIADWKKACAKKDVLACRGVDRITPRDKNAKK